VNWDAIHEAFGKYKKVPELIMTCAAFLLSKEISNETKTAIEAAIHPMDPDPIKKIMASLMSLPEYQIC
jgi:hypothetical protein